MNSCAQTNFSSVYLLVSSTLKDQSLRGTFNRVTGECSPKFPIPAMQILASACSAEQTSIVNNHSRSITRLVLFFVIFFNIQMMCTIIWKFRNTILQQLLSFWIDFPPPFKRYKVTLKWGTIMHQIFRLEFFLNSHIGISCLFSKKFLTENMTGKRRAKIQEIQPISNWPCHLDYEPSKENPWHRN